MSHIVWVIEIRDLRLEIRDRLVLSTYYSLSLFTTIVILALKCKSGVKLVVAVLAVLRVVHLINGWNPVNRLKSNDLRA